MRYAPAAIALSLLAGLTASVGYGATRHPDARAVALVQQGHAAVQAGDMQAAIGNYESALVLDPAYGQAFIDLGHAVMREGLDGKALHYFRQAQQRDPGNYAAIAGEGEALAAKGAEKDAQKTLAKLQTMCGKTCPEAQQLAAAIARGPKKVETAEAEKPGTAPVQKN